MARTKKYPGYVERHGRGFRVTLTLAGKRHRYSVRAESKSAAGEWASAKYEELQAAGERRDQGYPAPLRMSELFDRFEREWMPGTAAATQNSYKDSLKVLRPWFVDELHNPTVDRVRAGDVAAFMTWRRSHRLRGTAPVSARTLQRDRAVLHAVFGWADRLEMREGNPVERVPAPKVQPRNAVILTEPQYTALVAACSDPFVQLYGPSLQQLVDMITWRLASVPKRNHLPDFPQAQTDGLTRPDKPKAVEGVRAIVAITRRGA